MQREPNTEYILSLSYGKDSIACLEAIIQLGYPLDRIIHAEVWATDTIPADLPPMIDFKAKADKIIKERYGFTVEHICAVRGGVRNSPTNHNSTSGLTKEETKIESMVSLTHSERGVTADSKLVPCNQSQEQEKVTYEKLFYHIPKRRKKPNTAGGGEIQSKFSQWIPSAEGAVVQLRTQTADIQTTQFSDSQSHEGTGATATSNLPVYGFPISIGRGNWCTQLKQRVFFQPHCTRGKEKYCAVFGNCSR